MHGSTLCIIKQDYYERDSGYFRVTLENEYLGNYMSEWNFEMLFPIYKNAVIDAVCLTVDKYGLEDFNGGWGNCGDELPYDILNGVTPK